MTKGGGGNSAPLYDILFDLQISICERFHISPIQLRKERFSEFCLLVKRLEKHDEKAEAEAQESPKNVQGKNGKPKIYLPVTDYKPIKKGG